MSITEHFSKNIVIKGNPNYIYELCREYANFPKFLSNVQEVQELEDEITQWKLVDSAGKDITWKARVTRTDKNQRIAWNTLEGDIKTSGQAVFSKLPDDETQLSITMNYVFPDNTPSHLRERLMKNLERSLTDDLNNFKKHAEGMEERLAKRR